MNAHHHQSGGANHLSVFLLGAILNIMAAMDYTSLLDYSLKAMIGGAVWLGYKMLAEYLTEKVQKKKEDNEDTW